MFPISHPIHKLATAEFFLNLGRAFFQLSFAKFIYDTSGQIWGFAFFLISESVCGMLSPWLIGCLIDTKSIRLLLKLVPIFHLFICILASFILIYYKNFYATYLIVSILLTCSIPAIKLLVFNITPELVSKNDLEAGNALLGSAIQLGQFLGMIIAGFTLSLFPLDKIIFLIVIPYAISGAFYFLSTLVPTENFNIKNANLMSIISPAINFSFLFSYKPLLLILLISIFDLVILNVFNLLLPPIIALHYNNSPLWLAGLDAAFTLGAVASTLSLKKLNFLPVNINDTIMMHFIFLSQLLLLFFPIPKLLLPILIFIMGYSFMRSAIFWYTKLQKEYGQGVKGRITAIRNIIASIMIFISSVFIALFHQISFSVAATVSCIFITLQLLIICGYKFNSIKSH